MTNQAQQFAELPAKQLAQPAGQSVPGVHPPDADRLASLPPIALDLMARGVLPDPARYIAHRIANGARGYDAIGLLLTHTALPVAACFDLARQWDVWPTRLESEAR